MINVQKLSEKPDYVKSDGDILYVAGKFAFLARKNDLTEDKIIFMPGFLGKKGFQSMDYIQSQGYGFGSPTHVINNEEFLDETVKKFKRIAMNNFRKHGNFRFHGLR